MPNSYLPPEVLLRLQRAHRAFITDVGAIASSNYYEPETTQPPTAYEFTEWLLSHQHETLGTVWECVRTTVELSGLLPPMPYFLDGDAPRYTCPECHGIGWNVPDMPCQTCDGLGRLRSGPVEMLLTEEQAQAAPAQISPRNYLSLFPPVLSAANNAYHYLAEAAGRFAALGITPDAGALTLLDQLAAAITAATGAAPTGYLDYKARTEAALGLAIAGQLDTLAAGR